MSEPAPAVLSQKPVRTSVIVLSEPALPISLKAKPTSAIPPSEPSAPLLEVPGSVTALSEPVAPVSSLRPEPVSVTVVSAFPVLSSKPEPASAIALSEPLVEAALKPLSTSVLTASEPLPPASSLEPPALSELSPRTSSIRPVMSETTLGLPLASSSLDLKPPVLLSKPLTMTPSLELVQQSTLALLPTLSEPVSLTPLEPKLPTPESEPAYKASSKLIGTKEEEKCPESVKSPSPGLNSLASDCKSWCAVSTTRDIPTGPEQQLCGLPMEQRQTGQELSEACKPLIDGAGQEQLATQEVVRSSQVAELPKRKQWLAWERQSMDQQLVTSELKHEGHQQEQPKDSEKVHGEPASKKPRLSKQQLRELFSSSSEDEEAAEENTYTAFLSSTEHAALCRAASGKLLSAKVARTAMSKLSWLAMQPEVRPGVVASFVRSVKRDALIHAALLYLARTKANPVAAYCRGEQSPPLITKLETLLLDALALKTNGWAALLSSLRARLWSPQQPTQMLAQASYVRLVCTLCRELKQHKLALVTAWDLVSSGHAPFLVASAVGAWPGLLSALPPGPLKKAVGYILLHSPAHTLNSTLQSQAYRTLCELGPLQEFQGDERALVEELLSPLLSPHRPCRDICVTHCLALEQLSRRSPVGLLSWLLDERLGPHVQSLLQQPNAGCFIRLLGSLWKHYEKAALKLDTMLCEIASSLCHQEPALREAVVQAFLLLPGVKGSHWTESVINWQQSS
uniref:Uncharacterized protein n=1 Tax=Rhipicephalus appendiculatus TaxID=34631 RepID=A0A131YMP5_RHIAP